MITWPESRMPHWEPGIASSAWRDHADPFPHASGIELFQAASRRLDILGISTPRIHLADQSRSHYPAGIAVVEDVPGANLETLSSRIRAARSQPWHGWPGHSP